MQDAELQPNPYHAPCLFFVEPRRARLHNLPRAVGSVLRLTAITWDPEIELIEDVLFRENLHAHPSDRSGFLTLAESRLASEGLQSLS
jgi:hypothetical protein